MERDQRDALPQSLESRERKQKMANRGEKLFKAVEVWRRREKGKTFGWPVGSPLKGSLCSALALQGRPII